MNYKKNRNVILFDYPEDLFRQAAEELREKLTGKAAEGKKFFFAISGGNTPLPLFRLLAKEYGDMAWGNVELFWVDERMVPEDHSDSNYGASKELLLGSIPLKDENIHYIKGTADPGEEAIRYSEEIKFLVPAVNGIPQFDWIWLGMGADGHTASIFPASPASFSEELVTVTEHPKTRQKRVTMTEVLINNAKEILFLVTGEEKNEMLTRIFAVKDMTIPAARITAREELKWYICEHSPD